MNDYRRVKKIITGKNAVDGAGVRLVRVFGHNETEEFDPFLMLDAFDSSNPEDYTKGFPWHPHRGIETITYLISGDIEHGDSLGNKGSILNGECQWMTAGSGIIHQEMPKESPRMLGVQLWLNLPAKDKMTEPQYHGILSSDIPVVDEGTQIIRIIAGAYKNQRGAITGEFVEPDYLDIGMNPGAEWRFDTNQDHTVFIYIIQGDGFFGEESKEISEKHAVLFDKGIKLLVKAGNNGLRFLLLSGKPLNESIAWGGPIVMNTKEELQLAFKELDNNTFIKI